MEDGLLSFMWQMCCLSVVLARQFRDGRIVEVKADEKKRKEERDARQQAPVEEKNTEIPNDNEDDQALRGERASLLDDVDTMTRRSEDRVRLSMGRAGGVEASNSASWSAGSSAGPSVSYYQQPPPTY